MAASLVTAHFGPPGNGNPYPGGGDPYDGGDGDRGPPDGFGPGYNVSGMVTAHSVMATVIFGLLFPSGSILIRLGSFRGVWLVHGILQTITYILYIAAFAIGVYLATHERKLSNVHPVLGMVVFALLCFQPFLGLIHHFAFKKYTRRTFWSYTHLWLGRIVITLGIINGGLGLQLSTRIGRFAPHKSTVIGYSIAAALMWLIWVAAAIYGERKRKRIQKDVVETPSVRKLEGDQAVYA